MNLAGVLAAVALLMVLIYKKVSLIPATLICVLLLGVTKTIKYLAINPERETA